LKILIMKKIVLYLLFAMMVFSSCKDTKHAPLEDMGSTPPAPTVTDIINYPGGARVTYAIPEEQTILYVKAIFESRKGEEREVKSSVYKNYIELDGFGDTNQYSVKLYAVNRSEISSDPVEFTIQPLTPPIHNVFKSLEVSEDVGGVNTKFTNELQKNLVFYTLYKNEEGEREDYDRLLTVAKCRDYSVRGSTPEPTECGFYVKDDWGNLSDTLVKSITPLYEEMLDKSKFNAYPLPSDSYEWQGNWGPVSNLWDGNYANQSKLFYQATAGAKVPNWITIDLGQRAKFSRLVVFQSAADRASYAYNYGTPRLFEIWGSNNP